MEKKTLELDKELLTKSSIEDATDPLDGGSIMGCYTTPIMLSKRYCTSVVDEDE